MNSYRTSEVAGIIGVHPNTVRFYEEAGLIPAAARKPNGYRVFTDFHIAQFRLARTAFQVEVLQNGLRKKAIEIVKTAAKSDFDLALQRTESYIREIRREMQNAEDTIESVRILLSDRHEPERLCMKRQETADYLHISIDALRNWEMNGLLTAKRRQNGYRIYTDADIRRLLIIRTLRCANYSLSAILRLLGTLSKDPAADIRQAIDTPGTNDEILCACDNLLTSLGRAEQNALQMRNQLQDMKRRFPEALQ